MTQACFALFGGRYRCRFSIGSGSFGQIFIGIDEETGSRIAIKLEAASSRHPQVLHEAKVYKMLAGSAGVPRVHWYGTEGRYNAVVLDLFGPSLEDLFVYCKRSFNIKTVLMLADQMISLIEQIHDKHLVHRDIKPDNFVIGLGKKANHVHIIDFGLAQFYRNPVTQQHVPLTLKNGLIGTARYASVNSHLGLEQSRRDDLEAIGHVLMYFLRGSLPWQGCPKRMLAKAKRCTSVEELCAGYPSELSTFMTYCRELRFVDRPDYAFLRNMLRGLFADSGYHFDFFYAWTPSPSALEEASRKKSSYDEDVVTQTPGV